jgi:hypothetical protein
LRQIAQDNGLSPESVVLRTIAKDDPYAARLAPIQWFDQLIEQREFEEVLPWRLDRDPDVYGPGRKTWSDVISLWPGRNTKSLLVETAIGSDSRNWFLIVRLGEAYVEVLYRGRV